jgi:hypothetical protein
MIKLHNLHTFRYFHKQCCNVWVKYSNFQRTHFSAHNYFKAFGCIGTRAKKNFPLLLNILSNTGTEIFGYINFKVVLECSVHSWSHVL